MAKHHLRGWRSNALPFPHEWFRMAPSPPRLVARLAHNCFPLLPAGRRGTRFCHRTWSADASVEREQNYVPGGGVGRKSAAQAGPGGNALLRGSRTSPGFTQGKGSEAARGPGEEEETLAMEKGEQKVANGAQPGPRAAGCRRSVGPGAPVRRVRTGPPDVPRGSHLAAPWPGAGGWLVPDLSSSSSSLSREGLRGAKNREKVCQGAPPLLRPPDMSPARLPVRGGPRRTGLAVSYAGKPGVAGPAKAGQTTRATGAAQSIPGGRGAGATRTPRGCC